MKINALSSWGRCRLRLRVRLIWLYGTELMAQKKTSLPSRGLKLQTLLSLQCAAAGCLCPCGVSVLFLWWWKQQTSDVKSQMSWALKVVWDGELIGRSSAGQGMWLAGPQLARAMVSMTCSSLPRSRCLRDCSSFCSAVRICTNIQKSLCHIKNTVSLTEHITRIIGLCTSHSLYFWFWNKNCKTNFTTCSWKNVFSDTDSGL